ncbi:MAG: cadherin-like domain-containing protein, partial [Gammaproteobacteria bacterium]|nr:cadherin-like domain-containing protein [Gammaproteobacteria bacterium]
MAIPTQLKSRSVGETVLDAVTTAGEQIYTVLSTKLLLRGEYSRSGDDLIIRGEMGEELRVEGYFSGEASPTLQSPEGAVLLPTTVSKLLVNTESVDVAGPAGSIRIPGLLGDPIGTINDIGADANVTAKGADGFVRALKPGDPIYIDDVVETVGRSFVNLLMVDDTSFQLGKDTRAIIENYNFIAGAETGGFEATVLDGFFRYASGQLGGTDKGTHTTIKTPTAQVGVRGSEFEGMIEADGATTFLHHDGVLDVADAYGRGSVTLTEPGTATAVSSRPGAPLDAFEAPESLTKAFEEALPPLPDFVVEAREGEGSEEGVEVQLEVGLDEQIEVGLDEQSELEIESFELKQVELKELLLEEGAEEDGASISAVPVATADQFSGVEDQVISGNLGSNDKKGDGSHTWSKVGNATFGEVVVNADGTFTYHPSADFSGNDQFSYQVVDKDGDDSTAVVSISLSAINDAPEVVLAEGGTKTFIESSMATLLFSDAEVTTVESGQQLTTLVVTVEGLADGINEQLWIGNESIVLDGAISSGQIAGQSYITSLDGNTATVTLTGSWNEGDIINQLGYKNSSLTPTESSRLVTLKSLSDDGGTLKGGVDSQIFASGLASTVQITGINTAPTVVQGITTASYTEMMGATLLFSDAQVSTVESGQQLTGLVIEVSGLVEASSEQLWIGSESIKLDGSVASGQIGGKGYTVSVDQNVATVTLSGSWNAGEVIHSLGYKNSSQTPTESNRMVTLKSLSDDGGTLNGGEN